MCLQNEIIKRALKESFDVAHAKTIAECVPYSNERKVCIVTKCFNQLEDLQDKFTFYLTYDARGDVIELFQFNMLQLISKGIICLDGRDNIIPIPISKTRSLYIQHNKTLKQPNIIAKCLQWQLSAKDLEKIMAHVDKRCVLVLENEQMVLQSYDVLCKDHKICNIAMPHIKYFSIMTKAKSDKNNFSEIAKYGKDEQVQQINEIVDSILKELSDIFSPQIIQQNDYPTVLRRNVTSMISKSKLPVIKIQGLLIEEYIMNTMKLGIY